jgi:hypothetical protein
VSGPFTHGPFIVGFMLTMGGLLAYGIWQAFEVVFPRQNRH